MTRRKATKGQKLTIDGMEYMSINDAARQLGLTRQIINSRIRDIDFPNWIGGDHIVKRKKRKYEKKVAPVVRKKINTSSYFELWRKTKDSWYCVNKTIEERMEYDDRCEERLGYRPCSTKWNDFERTDPK